TAVAIEAAGGLLECRTGTHACPRLPVLHEATCDVRRNEHVLEIPLPLAARQRAGDAADELGVVDEHAPRVARERDVDAARLLVPSNAVALVQRDAVADDDPLDLRVVPSAAKD